MKESGSFVSSRKVGLPLPVEEEEKVVKEKEVKKVKEDEFSGKVELPYDYIGRWGWGA